MRGTDSAQAVVKVTDEDIAEVAVLIEEFLIRRAANRMRLRLPVHGVLRGMRLQSFDPYVVFTPMPAEQDRN